MNLYILFKNLTRYRDDYWLPNYHKVLLYSER